MIKRLITEWEQKRLEKKQLREKLNKKYPIALLYYGDCIKKVEEDGICFQYDHCECFMSDQEVGISSFVRLTGEGAESSQLEIYGVSNEVRKGVKYKQYYVADYEGAYHIDTLIRFGYSGYMTLDEIIDQLNWINKRAKERAKMEAVLDNK